MLNGKSPSRDCSDKRIIPLKWLSPCDKIGDKVRKKEKGDEKDQLYFPPTPLDPFLRLG